MRTGLKLLMSGLMILVICYSISFACDGVDRYAKRGAAMLVHVYEPISDGAGFAVLKEDMSGGADGAPAYRWARGWPISIIKIVSRQNFLEFGKGPFPMALFDWSAENGDTPIEWDPDKPPSGRHPGNSHDGGINLDLGYYMTSLDGIGEEADYAVCDDHHSKTEKDDEGNPKDVYQCVGPANRLDVDRQAYWFVKLFQMHADRFNSLLLSEIGIDFHIKKAVLEQIRQWQKEGKYNITDENIEDMEMIMTCDRWGGWARFHHHHIHLRLRDIDYNGPFRKLLNQLEEEERALDHELLIERHPKQKVFIDADLFSYRLRRSIDTRLFVPQGVSVTACEYRFGNSKEWLKADESENDFRYVFDLPYKPQLQEKKITITARFTFSSSMTKEISTDLYLPVQDPLLKIAVHKDQLAPKLTTEKKDGLVTWNFSLEYPPAYSPYLTKTVYTLFSEADDQAPIKLEGEGVHYTATYKQEIHSVVAAEANVYLSRRVVHTFPLFVEKLADRTITVDESKTQKQKDPERKEY